LEELGRAQEEEGEELAAAQTYASTKDYCVAPQHIIDMCTNVLRVNITSLSYQEMTGSKQSDL